MKKDNDKNVRKMGEKVRRREKEAKWEKISKNEGKRKIKKREGTTRECREMNHNA